MIEHSEQKPGGFNDLRASGKGSGSFCRLASRLFLSLLVLAAFVPFVAAAEQKPFGQDGIDRNDPNFVKASLLIASPIETLYSCVGHAALRMECPKFNLDYCFTYEGEQAQDKFWEFFAGKLKMGMFAVPTTNYLSVCAQAGRGVMQYRLNLPPDAKQRLWKDMDDRVAEGANLPYDYLRRGCAQVLFSTIKRAVEPAYRVQVVQWPERFSKWTRREFVDGSVQDFPWTKFCLYTMVGTECDRTVSKPQKVVIPADLLEILRLARINGVPVIDDEGAQLLPVVHVPKNCVITPMVIASGFVVLSVEALANPPGRCA